MLYRFAISVSFIHSFSSLIRSRTSAIIVSNNASHSSFVRGERWAYRRFFVLGGKLVVQRLVGLIRLAVADPALDLLRRLLLHGAGDVAVDVDGGRRGDMSNDGGERFHVHAVLQGGGGEGVAQVVEANVLTLRPHQHLFHLSIDALRVQRSVFFYGRGEHPARVRSLLQLPQHSQHRRR